MYVVSVCVMLAEVLAIAVKISGHMVRVVIRGTEQVAPGAL